jgi:hypothetical protein
MLKQVRFSRWSLPVAILLAVLMFIAIAPVAMAQEQGTEEGTEGVGIGLLIGAIIVGWVGNFLHRIKKVVKAETDEAIIRYIRAHKIVFVVGLVVAAAAVWAESVTYAKDVGSLMWSALITGYGADSLLEAK